MLQKFIIERIKAELPFVANTGQDVVIEKIASFLMDRDERKLFILKGYAGTGKTSLVSAIVRAMIGLKQSVTMLAPTGRAAKVISGYSGMTAATIHRFIYRQRQDGGFSLDFNRFHNRLFIVDEASMISVHDSNAVFTDKMFGSGNLLDDLIQYVYNDNGCSLLLLGDEAQLPPIGHSQSPALDPDFMKGYGLTVHIAELDEVVRQAQDSDILSFATSLREDLQGHTDKDLFSDDSIHYGCDIIRLSGADLIDALERSYRDVGIDETLILTRSNRQTNRFNQGIRARVLWREEQVSSGDRIMVVRNNYFWLAEGVDEQPQAKAVNTENPSIENNPLFIANGDIFNIERLYKEREMYGFRFADAILRSEDYENEVSAILWLDTLFTEKPEDNYRMQQTLYERISLDYPEIRNRRDMYKQVMKSPYYNALQIRFAYAVTCHKAQGGQWRNVFLADTSSVGFESPIEYRRWLYTAVTRAKDKLYIIR